MQQGIDSAAIQLMASPGRTVRPLKRDPTAPLDTGYESMPEVFEKLRFWWGNTRPRGFAIQ